MTTGQAKIILKDQSNLDVNGTVANVATNQADLAAASNVEDQDIRPRSVTCMHLFAQDGIFYGALKAGTIFVGSGGVIISSSADGATPTTGVIISTSQIILKNAGVDVVMLDGATGAFTLQSAASGARIVLTASGLEAYNSGGAKTVDINNDGTFTLQSAASGNRIELTGAAGMKVYGSDGVARTIIDDDGLYIRATSSTAVYPHERIDFYVWDDASVFASITPFCIKDISDNKYADFIIQAYGTTVSAYNKTPNVILRCTNDVSVADGSVALEYYHQYGDIVVDVTSLTVTDDLITLGNSSFGDVTAPRFSHVHATRDSAQSINSASATTVIYDDEVYDTLGEYSTSTGVFTATYAGYYQVNAALLSANVAWAGTNSWTLGAYDGTTTHYGYRWAAHATATLFASSVVSTVIYLAAGGTIAIQLLHDRGSATNTHNDATYCWMTIDRLL
jgi:hypothetical protein